MAYKDIFKDVITTQCPSPQKEALWGFHASILLSPLLQQATMLCLDVPFV
jgi:hypothetical protein